MRVPVDMPALLAEWLRGLGHEAGATPLPDDFEDRLPFTLVTSLGGRRQGMVLDVHRVQVDTYGANMADAMDEARAVYALIDSLNDEHPVLGGAQTYLSEAGGLPAESDDPNHPNVPVTSFVAQISCRALET